jgi:hypothetical protein
VGMLAEGRGLLGWDGTVAHYAVRVIFFSVSWFFS